MRKLTILAVAVMSFAACNQKTNEVEQPNDAAPAAEAATTKAAPPAEVVYTCSMHPEVTGVKGDKCPKCEMDLVPQE
jgi:hypothetical protein